MRSINELRYRAQRAIDNEESFVDDLAVSYGRSIRTLKQEAWFIWVVMEVLTEQYQCWAPHAQEVAEARASFGK